jgi:hypothetical protein
MQNTRYFLYFLFSLGLLLGCQDDLFIKPSENNSASVINLPKTNIKRLGNKHALLIGIEKYRNVTPLNGAVNDVKLTQQILRTRFGFTNEDFIILLNEQATHTAIEKAFNSLIKQVKDGDMVYIHFSGHGSQTADLNGDERSGEDQTWVSYGTRGGNTGEKDNYDVLDDEINSWLTAISAKTNQVIFVSDSCHSGTVSRGKAPVSRGLQKDERENPWGKFPYTQAKRIQGVQISAAQDNQLASEMRGEDGKHYGLFTWYWVKALQQAAVGETWHDIFKRTYSQIINKRGETQIPQIAGEQNRKIFGGDFVPVVQTIPVLRITNNNIEIQAGAVAGVTVGSIYRLYQPQNHSNRLPNFEITQVKAFKSIGKITQAEFKVGDLVVEKSHAYHFEPTKIYLTADYPNGKDKALLQRIKAVFKTENFSSYILTNNPYNADLSLYLLRPKLKNGKLIYGKEILPKSFKNAAPELWVLTPEQHLLHENLKISFSNLNKGIDLLEENLKKIARIREIKALKSPNDATAIIELKIDLLSATKHCQKGVNCINLPYDLGWHQKNGTYTLQQIGEIGVNQNDVLMFTLKNKSNKDYYAYLINIAANGSISAIFPDPEKGMEYARINAGATRALRQEVLLLMSELGEETLKLIISTRPNNVSLFQQSVFRTRRGKQKNWNPLEQLLGNAMHGTRGLSRVSEDYDWATEQVIFEVK